MVGRGGKGVKRGGWVGISMSLIFGYFVSIIFHRVVLLFCFGLTHLVVVCVPWSNRFVASMYLIKCSVSLTSVSRLFSDSLPLLFCLSGHLSYSYAGQVRRK